VPPERLVCTTIGGNGGYRIPYYALGRHGLQRLLLPSDRTQKPALAFAVDALNRVRGYPGRDGCGLMTDALPTLFDDCRVAGADVAQQSIDAIRNGRAVEANEWPPMNALGALVADSYCLALTNRGWERNAFSYGNVSPLINRIRRLVDDARFRDVVDVDGGPPVVPGRLDWMRESQALVERVFGTRASPWTVHIVNLRNVSQDLMPLVLGSLLELYAAELFRRGQGASPDTLLLLEEAHHYLRPVGSGEDARDNSLAYERLAKEGRKFGLGLWISTQRPSEISPTVLSQCGTWACFRLSTESDLSAIANATEWSDKSEIRRIAGLPKRHAIVFGSALAMPTLIRSQDAVPPPLSEDPAFDGWA
jgi:hypothetical protein